MDPEVSSLSNSDNNLEKIIQDIKNNKCLFVVENGFNTCYISSLLMALFYKASYLDVILQSEPKTDIFIYLQEIIKTKFVERVRNGTSVLADVMNEIRSIANICGWLNHEELMEQQDVNELFAFIANQTNLPTIDIQRETITEGIEHKSDLGEIETLPFLTLPVPDDRDEISIKNLLDKWMNNNTVDIQRDTLKDGNKVVENVKGLNIYRIMNVPMTIGISLNRFGSTTHTRSQTKIDIQKRIKFHNTGCDADAGLKWRIHSIICHTGETNKSGHYYAVIFGSDNKWFRFNDQNVPSLEEINIKNDENMNVIKRECVFLFYTYDDISQ